MGAGLPAKRPVQAIKTQPLRGLRIIKVKTPATIPQNADPIENSVNPEAVTMKVINAASRSRASLIATVSPFMIEPNSAKAAIDSTSSFGSAAICTGPHAHEDRNKRYTAAVWCGIFYGIAGVFGATLAALFAALPKELVLSIAALALFGSIINGLSIAMSETREREAALITFMVTASGLTLFSIGSAFWGIVAGVVTLMILNWRKA